MLRGKILCNAENNCWLFFLTVGVRDLSNLYEALVTCTLVMSTLLKTL